jgi:hypothetical protein
VENCAICRGHIMDLCIECQASTQANGQNNEECTVAWGACNVRIIRIIKDLLIIVSFSPFFVARLPSSLHFEMVKDTSSLSLGQSRMAISKVKVDVKKLFINYFF